jgi:ATP-dependent Clp protease ATP-binding subunit ClpC
VYERFTDRAHKVMQFACQEAQRFNHEYLGTEHILLGLAKEGSGVAASVLKNLDIDLRKIRFEVEKIVQAGSEVVTMSKLPQTPRAKKVIEYSIEEARNLNHNYVGTEHLLLGLLREEDGVAAQVLMNLGLNLQDVRDEVMIILGHDVEQRDDRGEEPVSSAEEPGTILDQLPENLLQLCKEYVAQLEKLTREKEEAISEQDFEKAAHLRDKADKLNRKVDEVTEKLRDIIRESAGPE